MQPVLKVFSLFFLLMISACQSKTDEVQQQGTGERPRLVVVVNYPLQFIIESLVGPEFQILNPVPPDENPEIWLPGDATIQTIQQADLIITNGADFADWVKKLSLPRSKVLRTSLAIKDALITVPDFEVHRHGTGGAHSHAGTVAFFWLDPRLMARQADAIAERLINLDPESEKEIRANLEKLKVSLKPLNQQLDQIQEGYPGLHWYCRRPVYQYLAKRCDWTMHQLHWKSNVKPNLEDWEQLKSLQEQQNISLMLCETEPGQELTKRLQEQGISVFTLNPLTMAPTQGDYVSNMQLQLIHLQKFLKQQQKTSSPEK
ncbi:high-affinity zinc transporter periplasmic component [Gimesia algae]|uniref:High-affinity zinc transporter periplasmic component n=2 Tax=Gimesia algae TaxID=2527971 RepID=A0A517VH16_9PLAN|nr:high-affinity zinc transporter periplasmic component [Gimesia algae]